MTGFFSMLANGCFKGSCILFWNSSIGWFAVQCDAAITQCSLFGFMTMTISEGKVLVGSNGCGELQTRYGLPSGPAFS